MTYKGLKVTWNIVGFTCPNGHGEFVETDPKKIFKIVKTGLYYCPMCEKSYNLTSGAMNNGITQ